MKVNFSEVCEMVKEKSNLKAAINMRDNGKITKEMAMVFSNGEMAAHIKANGKMI